MRIPRTRSELRRHGPTLTDAALRVQAEEVGAALAEQRASWRKGFTRRKVLAGAGKVGVAALGTQLVTTRVAFGAPGTTTNTLVVVFLRGGMDGLSALVPAGDANLQRARPNINIPASTLLPAGRGFGWHPAFTPLKPFWDAGQMTAVCAVASPDASRSHFQAQDCLERGTASVTVHDGWLDRTLAAQGPGTTFRAVAIGEELPRSLVGPTEKIVMGGLQEFGIRNTGGTSDRTMKALAELYTGLGDHPLAVQAKTTLQALTAVQKMGSGSRSTTAQYPGGGFARGLRDIASLIKAKAGLRVAAIDLGGWDTHTGHGTVEGGQMKNHLDDLAEALAAFCTDLGPALNDVTLVTMTEFGRRVEQNGNGGTDHGHGGIMILLGGGMNGGQVHGRWPGLAPGVLNQGDVPGANDYRDVLGEAVSARLGVGDVGAIFPRHKYTRLGIFR